MGNVAWQTAVADLRSGLCIVRHSFEVGIARILFECFAAPIAHGAVDLLCVFVEAKQGCPNLENMEQQNLNQWI